MTLDSYAEFPSETSVNASVSSPAGAVLPLPVLIGACIGSGTAHLASSAMPFQVDALMTGANFSATNSGWFGFFEIIALSLTMIALSSLHRPLPPVVTAVAGAALGAIANILLFSVARSTLACWGCAILIGVASGSLARSYIQAVSASRNVDRVYSIASGGGLIVIVGAISLVPLATRLCGPLGAFLAFCAPMLVATPLLLMLRKAPHAAAAHERAPLRLSAGGVALVVMWTLSSLGQSVAWSFAGRVGAHLALSEKFIVTLSSVGIIAGVLGSFGGAVIATMLPRSVVLLSSLVGVAAACFFSCAAWSPWSYAIAITGFWVFSMLSYAYLLGSAASLDDTGKAGTLCSGMDRLGFALGAPLGGLVVDHGSFLTLALMAAVVAGLAIPFCYPVLHRELRAAL